MRPAVEIAAISAVFVAGVGTVRWLMARARRDPAEQERRRRLEVSRHGRLVGGSIIDIVESSVFYSYTVAGVEYQAAQDIEAVRSLIPESLDSLIGTVSVKYLPSNPSNSILVSEEWSGFRMGPGRLISKGA